MDIPIYIVSVSDERKQRIKERFEKVGMNYKIVDGYLPDDEEVKKVREGNRSPCMMSHLKAIKLFYETGKEYGIIGEDDIYVRKTLKDDLKDVVTDFDRLNLDILLIGYLLPYQILTTNSYFPLRTKYTYHGYPDDQWGSQLYLIRRRYAKYVLEKYTCEWANATDYPFSSDWTITKDGNRALISPPLALEEYEDKYTGGQRTCRILTHDHYYRPDLFW